jgi:hypothetical protein
MDISDIIKSIPDEDRRKAFENCAKFFDLDKHVESMGTNENYDLIVKEQSFVKGRKLWLEITVDNQELSFYLYKWLYSKYDPTTQHMPFGCILSTIHFQPPKQDVMRDLVKSMMRELDMIDPATGELKKV